MLEDTVVFTLGNSAYEAGVAALINSLLHNGFKGKIKVGIPPPHFEGTPLENVEYIHLDSTAHPINLKTDLILNNPCKNFIYFDSDIIVNTKEFLEELESLIKECAVFPIEAIIPKEDFRRLRWNQQIRGEMGFTKNYSSSYYNAGFFAGNWDRDIALIEEWRSKMNTCLSSLNSVEDVSKYFKLSDQDVLNALLQDDKYNIAGISPPDWWGNMGGEQKPFLFIGLWKEAGFYHHTATPKTWLHQSVPLRPPNAYDMLWYKYLQMDYYQLDKNKILSKKMTDWLEHKKQSRYYQAIKKILNKVL
ncbi:hypothetical protein [Bernardetia sp.]|uniref:hypothetical protein n=1 Tax=Bernardetia sp. TaxID=1937974 RepID=UPI0025C5F260|nr:hypothetical protein [Bernardetia sp.]